jgi:hypothetical protein
MTLAHGLETVEPLEVQWKASRAEARTDNQLAFAVAVEADAALGGVVVAVALERSTALHLVSKEFAKTILQAGTQTIRGQQKSSSVPKQTQTDLLVRGTLS